MSGIEGSGIPRNIPLQPGRFEDDIENSGRYDYIKIVRGLGKTRKEARERMVDNARRLGADIIYEFKHENGPSEKYWPKLCEGKAYRQNSSPQAA